MRVLLVHGLGRTPLSLSRLRHRLRKAGHEPEYFLYFAFAQPYEKIRARLAERLRLMARDGRPVGLVGHSLGGLLLRHALPEVPELKVHHLVMLGTPNQPPRRARRAIGWLPWRLFTRSAGEVLASPEAYAHIPAPRVPCTVIAGTGGWKILSRPFSGEQHDGLVSVGETRISQEHVPVMLPLGHTFMMNDPRVGEIILELLQKRDDER